MATMADVHTRLTKLEYLIEGLPERLAQRMATTTSYVDTSASERAFKLTMLREREASEARIADLKLKSVHDAILCRETAYIRAAKEATVARTKVIEKAYLKNRGLKLQVDENASSPTSSVPSSPETSPVPSPRPTEPSVAELMQTALPGIVATDKRTSIWIIVGTQDELDHFMESHPKFSRRCNTDLSPTKRAIMIKTPRALSAIHTQGLFTMGVESHSASIKQ